MSAKTKDPQFVLCRWLDAWGEETKEATVASAHEGHRAVPMETIGWLLRQDDKGVSIYCERCTEAKEFVYRGCTFIPTGMIVEVIPFKLTKVRKPSSCPTSTTDSSSPQS
jgi:hypothetical protein